MLNCAIIMGRLTADPELRTTGNGTSVTSFSVAVEDITYYNGLEEFFARNSGPYYYFSTKAPARYCDVQYPDGCYLVFGREDRGLPEQLLHENRKWCVRLPMRADARSLNLSNTVAIGVYEVLRQWDYDGLLAEGHLRNYEWE